MHDDERRDSTFAERLASEGLPPLGRGEITTLQINVGKLCNQACHHCHVEAGPKRTEIMERGVAERIVALLARTPSVEVVDITGGAPELTPSFRFLVESARALGRRVIDRCNLTVLFEPGMEDLPRFLAANEVEIVASLPCYQAKNVDQQRGRGVFDKSLAALRALNGLGYGKHGSALRLDLVYNPVGPFLPPAQEKLEAQYRSELQALFGIEFHQLFTITNMPIKRFAEALERAGQRETYMALLVNHFNRGTIGALMCRSLVSVSHEGGLYDCDFNQMLELPEPGRRTIWTIESFAPLSCAPIATASHCFGCTAGAGSSCGGALQ